MADRLKEIEARAKAATPGPWEECDDEPHPDFGAEAAIVRAGAVRVPCGTKNTPFFQPKDTVLGTHWYDGIELWLCAEDRAFIAHAREDVPWLVAQVRERDAEIARLKADASVLRQRVSFEANAWQAARQDIDERDAEIARLRAELATASDARATIRDCFRCLKCDACLRRLGADPEAPDA